MRKLTIPSDWIGVARLMLLVLTIVPPAGQAAQPIFKPGVRDNAISKEIPQESIPIQGRVPSFEGETYSGPGQFKFVIFNALSGERREVWNNSSGATGRALTEPATAVNLNVRNGRYAVTLGDGQLTPTLPQLHPQIQLLSAERTLYVRV